MLTQAESRDKHRHPGILHCSAVVASHRAAWLHQKILSQIQQTWKVGESEDADEPAHRCLLAQLFLASFECQSLSNLC